MNLAEVKKTYTDTFKLEDDLVLDLIIAVVVATHFKTDPIWLCIIGGPSSGKSELVNTVTKVTQLGKPFCHPISTITENTFLSGMPARKGQEASLLHTIGEKGVIVMKDFTSIISMKMDKRDAILAQMREIYDGEYTKKTGNGQNESWHGKINWLGAVTDAIHIKEEESATMGRRTISFEMPEQTPEMRRRLTKGSREVKDHKVEDRVFIQKVFADFIEEKMLNAPTTLPTLPEQFRDNMEELADFITLARSPVARNFKGMMVLVPSPEMPMRVSDQLQQLAQTVLYINDNIFSDAQEKVFYKIGMDSISKQRRITLRLLAEYRGVSAKGLAQAINYPTETVRMWLQEINVLNICVRDADQVTSIDVFRIKPEYRAIMAKYGDIAYKDELLVDKAGYNGYDSDDGDIDPSQAQEIKTNIWDSF